MLIAALFKAYSPVLYKHSYIYAYVHTHTHTEYYLTGPLHSLISLALSSINIPMPPNF